jgi:DNA-directed RNA polymerase specialized sigma subunit
MMSKEEKFVERCRKALQQIYWNMIYHERKKWKVNLLSNVQYVYDNNFVDDVHSNIYLSYLINLLDGREKKSTPTGKYILKRHIIDGLSELEVAIELKISQQAVSKCKNNCLTFLRQKLESY